MCEGLLDMRTVVFSEAARQARRADMHDAADHLSLVHTPLSPPVRGQLPLDARPFFPPIANTGFFSFSILRVGGKRISEPLYPYFFYGF